MPFMIIILWISKSTMGTLCPASEHKPSNKHLLGQFYRCTLTYMDSLSSFLVYSIASSNVTGKDISKWRADSPHTFSYILHLTGGNIQKGTE